MYIPHHYEWNSPEEIAAFIRAHPFVLMVSSGSTGILGTHLPLVLQDNGPEWKFSGHIAAANAQAALLEGSEVMIVCSGPHAYISPQHYSAQQRVPTWDYLAVHLYGKVRISASDEERDEILESLIRQSEPAYFQEYQQLDASYRKALFQGIILFTITVHRIEATKKLSQDKPAADRLRIIASLENGTASEQALADYMQAGSEDKAS